MFLKIAHAMGTTKDKIKYTNSLEAFEESYMKGIRYFEVDLDVTKDGKIVAFHEENEWGELWLGSPLEKYDYNKIIKFRYFNKNNILFLENLIELLDKYKDIFFIFDTKRKRKKVKFLIRNDKKREILFLNRKILKNLNKKNIDIDENKFWINFIKLFNFENYNYYNNDELIYKEITSNISKKNVLNRIIPQVHIENIEVVSSIYDFPVKIWKDTQKSRIKTDLKNALKFNCQYYSCAYRPKIEEIKLKFNDNGVKVLTYSFGEIPLNKLNTDGAYIDI